MSVLKVIEVLAESSESWEDATAKGLKKAASSVDNIRSAYVNEHSVTTDDDGEIKKYRVNLKISFVVK